MPSLKFRMPSPSPFITSGILRPPNKISTIASTTNQWKILNSPMNNLHAPVSDRCSFTLTQDASPGKPLQAVHLQDNTLVACAPRHPLPVEVFQKRNSILAGNSGQILECRY